MSFNNLKQLTDSIKRGERVILFPPGMFALISLVLLLVIASVLLTSSVANLFIPKDNFEEISILQFSGLCISFIFAIFPNLMILSGKKNFSFLCFFYAIAIFFSASMLLLAGTFGYIETDRISPVLLICIALSIICIFLYRTASYRLVKEFFYLLKNPTVKP